MADCAGEGLFTGCKEIAKVQHERIDDLCPELSVWDAMVQCARRQENGEILPPACIRALGKMPHLNKGEMINA